MSDFEDDPWGDDPDWISDSNDEVENGTGQSDSKTNASTGIAGAQHTILLLDAQQSMFECYIKTSDDSEYEYASRYERIAPFDAGLIAAEKLLHHKVSNVANTRRGKRDGVAIVLFNCPQLANVENLANNSIRKLMTLKPPGVEQIQTIRSCLNEVESKRDIAGNTDSEKTPKRRRDLYDELYASKKEDEENGDGDYHFDVIHQSTSLKSALIEINSMLNEAKCVKKNSRTSTDVEDEKTLWIFTNEDDPINGEDKRKTPVLSAANDLIENEVQIKLWPMPRHDKKPFNRNIFYNHLVTEDEDIEEGEDTDTENIESSPQEEELDFDSIIGKFMETLTKSRKVQSIPFLLPDWKSTQRDGPSPYPGITIDIYQNVRVKKKPQPIIINTNTKKRTKKISQIQYKETFDPVDEKCICTYVEFGGEKIEMTKQEVLEIKSKSNVNPKEASLVLFGFKKREKMSRPDQLSLVDRSLFAYPNEGMVKGSRAAFASLHEAMLRKGVIGIGELLQRVNASSRLVAIIPQEEYVDEDLLQGLLLVPLAYEDDMRATPQGEDTDADDELVSAAVNMIKNLNLDSNVVIGESFENPVLKTFWNYIESIALGTELKEIDRDEDDTMPRDEKDVLKVCFEEIESFRKLLPEDEVAVSEKKRKISSVMTENASIDWFKAYKERILEEFTINDLKSYLRNHNLRLRGRKSDLIQRIEDHIESILGNDKMTLEGDNKVIDV